MKKLIALVLLSAISFSSNAAKPKWESLNINHNQDPLQIDTANIRIPIDRKGIDFFTKHTLVRNISFYQHLIYYCGDYQVLIVEQHTVDQYTGRIDIHVRDYRMDIEAGSTLEAIINKVSEKACK